MRSERKGSIMKSITRVVLAVVVGVGLSMSAFAATSAFKDFNVSASVAANCTINATDMVFGAFDPLAAANVDSTSTVTITCTKGNGATIDMNLGNNAANATLTTRAMSNGSAGYLDYQLYSDSSRLAVWTSFSSGAAPSKAARPFTVYGRIPAAADAPSGTYGDVVRATVNF
ncbi:MAG: spore coat U domain-containing protein [Acidobacteriota bacterium]